MKKILASGQCLFICVLSMAQPTISSFSPISGPMGTTVTLHGTNFNPVPTNNCVFFGATQAVVSSSSTDSITVIVPTSATYQYISIADTTTHLCSYSPRPFKVTFACGLPINTSSFSATIDSTTGASPIGIATGDLDGDGKPEIVMVNYDYNSVSILRNTSSSGSISYDPKMDLATGVHPLSVSIGDFNSDGKPDLAVSNGSDNTVSILKNTSSVGSISFEPKADFLFGFAPNRFAIGDLNRDGKLDLATANFCTSAITILENTSLNGTINFAAPFDYPPNMYPQMISIGDLDGDSIPDLAVSGSEPFGSATAFLFRNTSTGGTFSFAPKVGYALGSSTRNIAIGDLNDDGKMDIAVTVQSMNSVAVLKNTSVLGAVSFGAPAYYPAGYLTMGVAINDMNGDGKADLTTIAYPNILSVIRNASTPSVISFYPKVSFYSGNEIGDFTITDMDGDGKPDVNVVSNSSNTLSIHKNVQCEATGIFSEDELSSNLRAFPNPFSTHTVISFEKELKNCWIKIIDIIGKEVRSINFSGDRIVLEKEELKAGIYFVQVVSENEIIATKKLIIE